MKNRVRQLEEALRSLEGEQPQVVILGICIGGMVAVLQDIRDELAKIRVDL